MPRPWTALPAVPADFLAAAQQQANREGQPLVVFWLPEAADWSFCLLAAWPAARTDGAPQFLCCLAPWRN